MPSNTTNISKPLSWLILLLLCATASGSSVVVYWTNTTITIGTDDLSNSAKGPSQDCKVDLPSGVVVIADGVVKNGTDINVRETVKRVLDRPSPASIQERINLALNEVVKDLVVIMERTKSGNEVDKEWYSKWLSGEDYPLGLTFAWGDGSAPHLMVYRFILDRNGKPISMRIQTQGGYFAASWGVVCDAACGKELLGRFEPQRAIAEIILGGHRLAPNEVGDGAAILEVTRNRVPRWLTTPGSCKEKKNL